MDKRQKCYTIMHMIEKFFNNTCTPEEAKQILEWFDTPEGSKYLEEKLRSDVECEDTHSQLPHQQLDSEKLFGSIQEKIKIENRLGHKNRYSRLSPLLRVAAVLLLVFAGSFIYFSNFYELPDQKANSVPVIYMTGDDQQKKLTLSDGSKVRLNRNSRIWISGTFSEGDRTVELEGEAYFRVAHDPDKPFIINTGQASIQVLGTAFNVKARSSKETVQVAVVEGSVSLSSSPAESINVDAPGGKQHSVVLTKGQFGYVKQEKISVEDFGVQNYLAWMRGRLVFEDLKLSRVCAQLTRLYNTQCSFPDKSLKNLSLTANISDDSLGKILSVISLSLDLNYRIDDNQIIWFNRKSRDELNVRSFKHQKH